MLAEGRESWDIAVKLIVKQEAKHIYFFTILFFVLTIIKVMNHELWSDETEPWLIARDSNSIRELLINKQFESHPNLWYFILYGITRFSHNVYLMQALHVLIVTGAVFLFLRYATFPLLTRLLFCFGYFMFYEFSVLSRIYALGLLFIFGACAIYSQRYKYWILFCILLCLAAQSNLFAGMISGGIVMIAFYKQFFKRDEVPKNFSKVKFWVGAFILLFGFIYAILSMMKHPDHAVEFKPFYHIYYVTQRIALYFNAFFPIAPFKISFWGENIFPSYRLKTFISVILLFFIYAYLYRNKHIFLVYFVVVLSMLSFFFFMYFGYIRHHGHMFIFFIVGAWINNLSYCQSKNSLNNKLLLTKFQKEWTLNIILLLHLIGGLQASGYDLLYKFSGNKEVADYIDSRVDKSCFIIGSNEFYISPITAYSKVHTKIYYYNTRRFGSYFIPDFIPEKKKYSNDSLSKIINYCKELSLDLEKDIILISSVLNVSESTHEEIKKLGVEKLFASSTELIYSPPLTVYKIPYKK